MAECMEPYGMLETFLSVQMTGVLGKLFSLNLCSLHHPLRRMEEMIRCPPDKHQVTENGWMDINK